MTTLSQSDLRRVQLPNGREATFEDMQRCGNILQDFIRDQEEKLTQVTDTHRHNQIIDYLQTLADGYNEQLQLYKATEKYRKQQQLVALIQFVDGYPKRVT